MVLVRNTILLRLLFSVVVLGLVWFGVVWLFSWYHLNSMNTTLDAMNSTPFVCLNGSEVEVKPWGFNGKMRYCQPYKSGSWEGWQDGYKKVQGNFENGEKQGEWLWFDSNGKVVDKISY